MNTALSKRPNQRRDSASRLEGIVAGAGDRGRVAAAAIASLDVDPLDVESEKRGIKRGTAAADFTPHRLPRAGFVCLVVFASAVVGLLGGCTGQLAPEQFAPAGPPSTPLVPGRSSEYVVKKGDTLYAVGWVFGVDYRELGRINGIEDPRKLKIGQVLLIPETETNLEFAFPALDTERAKKPASSERATAEPAKIVAENQAQSQTQGPAQVPTQVATSSPNKTEDVPEPAASADESAKPQVASPAPESGESQVAAVAPEPAPSASAPKTPEVPNVPKAPKAPSAPVAKPSAAPAAKASASAVPSSARATALPSGQTKKKPLPRPPSTKVAIARPEPIPLPTKVDRWIWPTSGKVIGTFRRGGGKGIDIGGDLGQQVKAAAMGEVVYVGNGLVGYGNMIIIKHTEDILSAYAHNRSLNVKEGEFVPRGHPIAEMGSSGTDRVKLHFEIRHRGKPIDPLKRLPR